jgi:predicted site-specific integrase-resolvase
MNNIETEKMTTFMTAKKAKEILGVHIQTLYNWERSGKIETIRTAGGHRMYNVKKYLETYANPNYEETDTNDKHNDKHNNNEIQNNKTDNEINDKTDNKIKNKIKNNKDKLNICYIRVSTLSQKNDLERQRKFMVDKYPTYEIIEDIGSGINFNRKGLRKIIKLAISGKINKLVVAYKDRLTRFGYELIEDLIKDYSDGNIIIEDSKEIKKEPKEEIVEDVLQILNVYTSKMNGLRKYSKNTEK